MPFDPNANKTPLQAGPGGSNTELATVKRFSKPDPKESSSYVQPKTKDVYRFTLSDGKQRILSQTQVDWVKSRYVNDAAEYYGDSPEDQLRKKTGAIPLSFQKAYGSNAVDKALLEMGMPSQKYFDSYLTSYNDWYGDGQTYKFDSNAESYIKSKFQKDWTYEYTIEDQKRKAAGLMPLAIEKKYGDTYRDSKLMQQGLPPESMLSDFVGAYQTIQTETKRKDEFYFAVTKLALANSANPYKVDDATKQAAFDAVISSSEWEDVAALYDEPPKISDDGTVDTIEEYQKKWSAQKKAQKSSDEPTVSYAEFSKQFLDYKGRAIKEDVVTRNAVSEAESNMLASVTDKATAKTYIDNRKDDAPAEVFAAMYDSGVPLTQINNAKKHWKTLTTDAAKLKEIEAAFSTIQTQYNKERAESKSGSFWVNAATPDLQGYMQSANNGMFGSLDPSKRKDKKAGDTAIKNGVVKQYDAGATSTIDADDAEKIFKSHLVYDEKGKPTKESIALATNMMYEAGATTPIVLEVGKRAGMKSGIFSQDYADKQKETLQDSMMGAYEAQVSGTEPVAEQKSPNDLTAFNSAFSDVVAERDLAQRKELIDASYKANVESGSMTSADFYNAVRRAGWGDTIDAAKDAQSYYTEVYAPKFAKNGEQLPKWEEIDQAAFIENFESGKDLNPDIHKTGEEIVRGSLSRAFTSGIFEVIGGAVSFADMATAKISGRTDTWDFTKRTSEAIAASQGVSSNQSFGSQAASLSSTVASELIRMYTVSQIGSGVLSMFSKGASAIAGAVSQTNAGNLLSQIAANATPAMTKGASALVKGTKWLISSSPFIATSMGSYYTEAVQSGANVDQAVLYGTVCGAMEGALEAVGTELWLGRMFGGQSVAKGIISAGKAAFKSGAILPKALMIRLVSSTLGNALEEGASYAVSIGMQKATYNKDAQFDWTEAGNQALMGGLIGLLGAGMNAGADTQSNILAEFMNSKAGQEWLADDKNNSAFTDMFVMSTIADTVPDQVRSAMRMQENGKSVSEVSAMVRDIDQHSRQMDAGEKQYADDIAKIDAELGKKQNAVTVLATKMEQAAADKSAAGMKKWSKIAEQFRVAQSELDVEQAQADAKRTERTAAFTETQEQHKIAISKAQESLKGVAVSIAEAFDPQISQIRNLVRDKVIAVPNDIAQEIIAKMDAAHSGKLLDYIRTKNDLQQQQYESVNFPSAQSTSPAQPAGDAQTVQAPTVQPTAENASIVSAEPVVTNAADALSEYKAELEAMASENQTSIEDRLSFSGEELPYVRVGLKVSKSASDKAIGTVKDHFKSWRGMAIHEQFQREVDGVVLQVLSDNPKYTENPDAIVSRLTNAFKHVSIDYNPTDMGYKGYDGREIESIRTLMRSQSFALGYYKNDGTLKRDFNEETRKSAFGSIMLKKKATKRGEVLSNIDTFYTEELTPRYPDLFPEELSNPQDMLDRMVEFMKETKRQENVRISDINSGSIAYEIASQAADGLISDLIGSYNELRTQRGAKSNDNTGKAAETARVVAEANSSTQTSQPETVAEKSEATPANPAETMGKKSEPAFGIVDPRLQQTVDTVRRAAKTAYKFGVTDTMGLEKFAAVGAAQSKKGAVDSTDLLQWVRNSSGRSQYLLNNALVSRDGIVLDESFNKVYVDDVAPEDRAEFNLLRLAKQNSARMRLEENGYGENKPVLASETEVDKDGNPAPMSATESDALAAKIEAAHPDFTQKLERQKAWWKKFGQSYMVDSGLWTQETFDALNQKYPDYVPTYRVDKKVGMSAGSVRPNSIVAPSVIRAAKGSLDEIVNPTLSFAKLVERYVSMESIARLSQNAYAFAEKNPEASRDMIAIYDEESGQTIGGDVDFVSFDEIANENATEVKDGKYIVRSWKDGKKIAMSVNKDIFDAYKSLLHPQDLSLQSEALNKGLKIARSITKPTKAVITGINPAFGIRNPIMDSMTYFMFTEANALHTYTNVFEYIGRRASNDQMWKEYLFDTGKGQAGFVTGQFIPEEVMVTDGKVKAGVKKAARVAGRVLSFTGEVTENSFRFAEYREGRRKYGDSPDARLKSAQMAADITVNFSRSGAATKAADAVVMYLNANVQGVDKLARTVAARPIKTIARGMTLAAMVTALRYIFRNDENPHYDNLPNYVKDANILVPNVFGERDENGYCTTFVKLPKGRQLAMALIATTERFARMFDGEPAESAFADLGENIIDNFAVQLNPFWQPLTAAKTNKNWYGGDIVPRYMKDNEAAPDQTTAQNTWVADAISERLYEITGGKSEVSPMHIDYMINQFGGNFFGKIVTGATAKDSSGFVDAAGNVVKDMFVVDPLYQSGVVNRFYDAETEAQYAARESRIQREELNIGTKSKDEVAFERFQDYKDKMANLRKREREILATELDTPERKAKIDAIREEINRVAAEGIAAWNGR